MIARRRRSILYAATLLALSAAILPLICVSLLSRERAHKAERAHLAQYAGWTLERATLTLSNAQATLKQLEQEGWVGCSPAHIARMRQLAFDNRFIDQVGYFNDGKLACTSWGTVSHSVPEQAPEHPLPGGFALQLQVNPLVSQGHPVIGLVLGDHRVLINPQRLVDVLRDGEMALGVATADGRPIAISGHVDNSLISAMAHHTGSGMDDRNMFVSTSGAGLMAFAVSDREEFERRLRREWLLLVPTGLIVSAILIGTIAWVSRQRLSPENELDFAIRHRKLIAHYQPLIELQSGRCIGAEALVRWRRPGPDRMPPDLLIPLAERTGLIEAITDLMIECVAEDLARMLGAGLDVHVAINISANDMESGRFLPNLHAALQRWGIPASHIWLEATERGFIKPELACATIERARAAGHAVSIDDFGTGYSSLSLLEALPVDTIKIDKSFVDTIGRSAATSVVTPHLIDMAHSLNLTIVAEGVESPSQEAYLRSAGVEFAQGWLYSPALSAEKFIEYCHQLNDGPN
ncbi:sensor c-di-GMP phosphodiesterase-like protein [Novosphingobium sp. PhB165]|uniref:EAL domain-containing protein n=1 Tax=Novosphingobium sp. PhB165 TaxID=2485105 RepID=UPI0010466911|nr:EAL domain-containing protein [Novosphingobium sp. PhB165]TCM16470.1 sensor c-di-GMP phosphodiesterase-like protein [Novosphingobium sp. PhB165]